MLCDKSEKGWDGKEWVCWTPDSLSSACYGSAVTGIVLSEDGEMWIGNGEYESRVNFCPVCGLKAPSQYEPPAQE